jgi:hypothetical protein
VQNHFQQTLSYSTEQSYATFRDCLRNMNAPIGSVDYITSEALPEDLEAGLPTVAQREAELGRLEN